MTESKNTNEMSSRGAKRRGDLNTFNFSSSPSHAAEHRRNNPDQRGGGVKRLPASAWTASRSKGPSRQAGPSDWGALSLVRFFRANKEMNKQILLHYDSLLGPTQGVWCSFIPFSTEYI